MEAYLPSLNPAEEIFRLLFPFLIRQPSDEESNSTLFRETSD
jgi:hypothetical protein